MNFFNVSLQAGLLWEASLAEWADEEWILVLSLHVGFQSRLRCEHLVAVLAREALAYIVMESLNVS